MLVKVSMDTIETTAVVLFIVAAASIFAWVLTTTQRHRRDRRLGAVDLQTSRWVFLLLANIFLLFVGCFMETIAAITILVPVFMPIIAKLGIDPVHFGAGDGAEPDDRAADAAGRDGAVRPAEGRRGCRSRRR